MKKIFQISKKISSFAQPSRYHEIYIYIYIYSSHCAHCEWNGWASGVMVGVAPPGNRILLVVWESKIYVYSSHGLYFLNPVFLMLLKGTLSPDTFYFIFWTQILNHSFCIIAESFQGFISQVLRILMCFYENSHWFCQFYQK